MYNIQQKSSRRSLILISAMFGFTEDKYKNVLLFQVL